MIEINKKIITANSQESIYSFYKRYIKLKDSFDYPKLIAVTKNKKLIGSISDGDLKRHLSKNFISEKTYIKDIMNVSPLKIEYEKYQKNGFFYIRKILKKSKRKINELFVIRKNRLEGILKLSSFSKDFTNIKNCNTLIVGMSYVGLTLALHLNKNNIITTGYDLDKKLISNLKNNKTHIYEKGLSPLLKKANSSKKFAFINNVNLIKNYNVFFICVGTPLKKNATNIDLKQILSSIKNISSNIKLGSLVIMRSTLPIGYSRKFVIPHIEKNTSLKCGIDWNYIFAPERTIEGNAINELNDLPQIIGGFSKECESKGYDYFNQFTSQTIISENLEAAELSKLISNTYRDLNFAFANEISLIANKFDINSNKLIKLANYGYSRNNIPCPSPGVGGYCLTKDPYLFSILLESNKYKPRLGLISRSINKKIEKIPFELLKKFLKKNNKKYHNLKVLVLGIAFKGNPPTSDTRNSPGLNFAYKLSNQCDVYVYDNYVVKNTEITKNKIKFLKIKKNNIPKSFDAIFCFNNDEKLTELLFNNWLSSKKNKFFFDGWGMFDYMSNIKSDNLTYKYL